jgi:hypothetical protein
VRGLPAGAGNAGLSRDYIITQTGFFISRVKKILRAYGIDLHDIVCESAKTESGVAAFNCVCGGGDPEIDLHGFVVPNGRVFRKGPVHEPVTPLENFVRFFPSSDHL